MRSSATPVASHLSRSTDASCPPSHRKKGYHWHSILSTTLFSMVGGLLGSAVAEAQMEPGTFAAFPSQSALDGRFLSFGCSGVGTPEQASQVALAVPATTASFEFAIFDGETDGFDALCKRHWDLGTRQLKYSLYADPLRESSTAPAHLIGEWLGNAENETKGQLWVSSSAVMPDNEWWSVTVGTSALAQAPSGNYFYNLVIDIDGACAKDEVLESNLKIATSDPVSFRLSRFGLVGEISQSLDDDPFANLGARVMKPGGGNLPVPVSYDGTFELFFSVPAGTTETRLFDGDFDFGTDLLASSPSGVVLDPCVDTDDPDTDPSYAGFPFLATGANQEGASGPGSPPDDNPSDELRRGELGDPNCVGCVRYEVTDPEGRTYLNDNPSGNYEWEQFLIASSSSAFAGNADVVYGGATLPSGMWKVKVIGLDVSNPFYWYADTCATRPAREPLPNEDPNDVPRMAACPDESKYLLGNHVWVDTANPGTMDPGEAGLPGVLMNLIRSTDGTVIATTRTGDPTSPNWAACVANNSGTDTSGLYCFGLDTPGTYEVQVAASNFETGQPLAGRSSTTGGDASARTLTTTNVLNCDFGYGAAMNASLGDRLWLDADRDGVQDAGEAGINGVTLQLLDKEGLVITKKVTAGDGSYTFQGLAAGMYSVRVVASTLPKGLVETYDLDGAGKDGIAKVSLAESQIRTDVDFGYAPSLTR